MTSSRRSYALVLRENSWLRRALNSLLGPELASDCAMLGRRTNGPTLIASAIRRDEKGKGHTHIPAHDVALSAGLYFFFDERDLHSLLVHRDGYRAFPLSCGTLFWNAAQSNPSANKLVAGHGYGPCRTSRRARIGRRDCVDRASPACLPGSTHTVT